MRETISTIIRGFLDEVENLLLAEASVFLSLPAKNASQVPAWKNWKASMQSMRRDHLCRCVLSTEPNETSRQSLDAVMAANGLNIERRWAYMMLKCRGASDDRVKQAA